MRLDEIEKELGDEVEVVWKSFLLRPEPEKRTVEKFTAYTQSWQRPDSMEPQVTFNQWSGENAPPSHSMPSAIAGKVAASFGPDLYRSFHHRAMEAYFTENRTISELGVLRDIAEESGIDRNEFEQRWESQYRTLMDNVVDDHNDAINAGVNGVPAVVVGEKYLIGGAVDVDDYRDVIARFRSETNGQTEEDPS